MFVRRIARGVRAHMQRASRPMLRGGSREAIPAGLNGYEYWVAWATEYRCPCHPKSERSQAF